MLLIGIKFRLKKKKTYILLILFVHIYYTYAQQITTDITQQPNELIQNLVGNDCVSVSNISSPINGNINNIISYGAFNNNDSNFPLQSGLILSTGRVNSAGNPTTTQNLSEGNIDWVTDPDILNVLGIDQTLNATSIEFDFSSPNSFVSFNYLFASEEYQQEYPCNFQDVFAILIKRAGTTDPYVNIALVPNTTTEISTNTIHPNITGFCDAQNEDYFQGYTIGDTNFNGRTEVLTARADIIANETYHIKMVIADHIDQRFDSAVFIEAEGFGNSINLGPDQSICGSDLTLDAYINNPLAIYSWFLNDNPMVGENNPTLDVYQSGTYTVEISIPTTSDTCTLSDAIEIEIIAFQDAAPIEDLSICDAIPIDGLYDFDFPSLKNDEIFDSLPSTDYTITYHLSQDDAQSNSNPILGLYQNTEQEETIFVRIESLSGDCLRIGGFNIMVNNSPNTLEYMVSVCNGLISEITIANLSSLDFPVSNYEFNTTVSYYLTEDDAINQINVLEDYPSLLDEPLYFIGRVENIFNGCFSLVRIYFDYDDPPDLGINKFIINACLDPNYLERAADQDYTYNTVALPFNLEDAILEVQDLFPGADVRILALISGNPRIVSVTSPTTAISIGISFDGTYCEAVIQLELHKNLLYNVLGNDNAIYRCDDASNDNIVDFDLTEIAEELKQDYDIDLQFYETEEDRANGSDPLDQNTPFSVTDSQTIFINSSFNECSHFSEVTLNIYPALVVPPKTLDYCGNLDPNSNTTNIVIEPLVEIVLDGLNIAGPVKFYFDEDDAENQTNEITESYNIIGNQQIFYVRVLNIFTGCYDISTLQVNITNAIDASNPEPLIVCDDDQDLEATVNLENVIPQLSDDSNDLAFTFYETFENAVESELPILIPSNYTTTSTTVFIRAEITDLECFTIFPFEVLIYSNPQLSEVANFINCEVDPNDSSDFILINKDLEIINGQSNMQVLYFETEDAAINRQNPIDKNVNYAPLSNPQTLYVRLENEAGNGCFKVAPMQIEVLQAPIYNSPTDVFECDINKTGLATTDLNEKITEISAGSPTELDVTFHLTPLNAELGSNAIPLIYTATSNLQLIYTRVENINTGCYETPSFSINTLSLPDIQFGKSLTSCGNNNNIFLEWDLTQVELEILEGRQYNIGFTYFESEEDALTDSNPIVNPEFYTNTSNPQTIYAKIINATTDCYDTVPFELIVNTPPQINAFETYSICENIENSVNLLDINDLLLDNTFNVLINYFSNEVDAEANENPLDTDYVYTNTTETLFARIEFSTTHCYIVYPFQLIINPLPIANTPNNLVVCDDDFDGLVTFNLTQQNSVILGNQNPTDFSITFYNSEINTIENTDSLSSIYEASNGETIFVRLENNTTGCYDITQFSTVVNPLPFVSVEDQVICLNDLPLLVSASTNISSDTYLWSTGGTSSEIEIYETGSYSVTITNLFGCENTSTFNVTESESATIQVVETIDFSDPNNITITVEGIGNYLYQLNDGLFQTFNTFQNVPIGFNTITIKDQNGCASITREVLVIDTPKHLSPNDDGDFDTWHITGVETLPGTIIHIFDRYGKLITQLNNNTQGWDGTYNGKKMPTGDYWFVADIIQNGKQFQVKGHFTLRR